MSGIHQRSVSATERRSTNVNTGPSRVNSKRAKDNERPFIRDSGARPASFDYESNGNGDRDFQGHETQVNGTEHRRTKSTITTTETYITRRSPVKEGKSTRSRGTAENQKPGVESPSARRKAKVNDFCKLLPCL